MPLARTEGRSCPLLRSRSGTNWPAGRAFLRMDPMRLRGERLRGGDAGSRCHGQGGGGGGPGHSPCMTREAKMTRTEGCENGE